MKKKSRYFLFFIFLVLLFKNNIIFANDYKKKMLKKNGENVEQIIGKAENFFKEEIEKEKILKKRKEVAGKKKEEVKKEETVVTVLDKKYYTKYKSVFLSKKDLNILPKVLGYYFRAKKNIAKEDIASDELVSNLESGVGENNISNVYLKSIMFISKNFWSVWLNDYKISNITNSAKDLEFQILNINREEVEVLWTVSSTKWEFVNKKKAISPNSYSKNKYGNIEMILKLKPNQTFVGNSDQIIEGKFSVSKVKEKEKVEVLNVNENIVLDNDEFTLEDILSEENKL